VTQTLEMFKLWTPELRVGIKVTVPAGSPEPKWTQNKIGRRELLSLHKLLTKITRLLCSSLS